MAFGRPRVLEVLLLPVLLTPIRKRRLLAAAVAGVFALVVVCGGAALWVLTHGPTSLGLLVPRLERAASARLAPLAVRLDGLVLERWEWGGQAELRLVGVELLAADGEPIAVLDTAKLVFAPGLLRGELALLALEVDGLELAVTRTESGALELDVGAAAGSSVADSSGNAELLEQWLDPGAEGGIARLERILLQDAALRVVDRMLGLDWRAEGLDLELRRGAARITGKLELELLLDQRSAATASASAPDAAPSPDDALPTVGGATAGSSPRSQPIGLRLEGSYDLATRRLAVAGDVDRLVPARLLDHLGYLEGLDEPALEACLEQPLRGELEATTDEERRASAVFSVRSTAIDLDGSVTPPAGEAVATLHLGLERFELGRCGAPSDSVLAAALAAPLQGTADLDFAAGALRAARFELGGVPGTFQPGRLTGTIDLETAPDAIATVLELHDLELWRLARIRQPLAPLDRLRLALSGHVSLRVAENELASLALDLTSAPGELRLPFVAELLAIGASSLRAEASEGLAEIRVSSARLALEDRVLDATLEASRRGDSYQGRLEGVVSGGSIAGLLALWPPDAGAGARSWIEENLDGTLGEARVALTGAFDPGADGYRGGDGGLRLDSIDASVPFSAVTLRGVLAATPIEGLEGLATFARDRIEIGIGAGRAGELRLAPGRVTLLDLGSETPRLEVETDFAAPLEAAFAIAAADPIGVDLAALSGLDGAIAGRLELGLPLVKDGPGRDRLTLRIRSTLEDLAWADGPLPVESGRGELEIDLASGKLAVRGGVDTAGIAARVELARDPAAEGTPVTTRLRARMDEPGIRSLGLGVERWLTGETSLEAEYASFADGAGELRARAELTRSVLDLPALGWRKEAGVPGEAAATARRDREGAWTVDELTLDAGDLDARAAGRFTVEPLMVEQARLDRLTFPGGDLRAEAARAADGGYRVEIGGEHFDAGPLLAVLRGSSDSAESTGAGREPEQESEREPEQGPTATTIEVTLARLGLGGERALREVQASAVLEGGTLSSVSGSATLDPAGTFSIELGPAVDGVGLRVETDDLGAVLEALQGTAKIADGEARIEAHGPSLAGPLDGTFSADDFRIVDLPALYRILTLGSLEGLLSLSGKSGIPIRSVDADLHFEDGRLEVRDLHAEGPAMVLGLDGTFDFAASTLAVEGLVTRNSLWKRAVGKVPVLKWALKLVPGVVAAKFEVEGPFDDPEVSALPVASLTPELLDDMVGLLSPRPEDERSGKTGRRERRKDRRAKPE